MIIKGRQWHFRRCLIALSAVFLGLAIFCSSAIAQSSGLCSITGNVVDQRGNSVPGAFVELILNGSIVKSVNNPQLSGDGGTKPFGSFNFTGLAPGKYVVTAEITTPVRGTFNGSAQVNVVSGMVNLDVKLPGYVYAYSTPTPTPTPTPVPTPVPTPQAVEENAKTITPEPAASESSATTSSGISGIFKNSAALLMVGMFSLIIVGGAGVFTISSRSGQKERYPDNGPIKKDENKFNNPGPLPSTGVLQDIQGYEEDIASIVKIKKEGKIVGADYYKKVNDMAEKYRIDQSTILYDISKRMKAK